MSELKTVIGQRPQLTRGMHHVALFVPDIDEALFFYRDLIGMEIEWQPDQGNIYLCSGNDNLALHHHPEHLESPPVAENQRLDHIGFILKTEEEVDDWFEFLTANDVKAISEPRTHRDGARSFYCLDPAGTTVQIIYHPPISPKL